MAHNHYLKVIVPVDRKTGNTNLSERCGDILRSYRCTFGAIESNPGDGTYYCQFTANSNVADNVKRDLMRAFPNAIEITVDTL
ncbi:hypothetical protein [Bacteroides sp.]|uniref:hypothetical protein n=1 Tax=Bacteroides sp. TaxID=29523 RepID=UPI003AB1B809